MCRSNTKDSCEGIALTSLRKGLNTRMTWKCNNANIQMLRHMALHEVTKQTCTQKELPSLLQAINCYFPDSEYPALVTPRIQHRLHRLFDTLVSDGVVVSAKLDTGGWKANWPSWTKQWLLGDWDGDTTKLSRSTIEVATSRPVVGPDPALMNSVGGTTPSGYRTTAHNNVAATRPLMTDTLVQQFETQQDNADEIEMTGPPDVEMSDAPMVFDLTGEVSSFAPSVQTINSSVTSFDPVFIPAPHCDQYSMQQNVFQQLSSASSTSFNPTMVTGQSERGSWPQPSCSSSSLNPTFIPPPSQTQSSHSSTSFNPTYVPLQSQKSPAADSQPQQYSGQDYRAHDRQTTVQPHNPTSGSYAPGRYGQMSQDDILAQPTSTDPRYHANDSSNMQHYQPLSNQEFGQTNTVHVPAHSNQHASTAQNAQAHSVPSQPPSAQFASAQLASVQLALALQRTTHEQQHHHEDLHTQQSSQTPRQQQLRFQNLSRDQPQTSVQDHPHTQNHDQRDTSSTQRYVSQPESVPEEEIHRQHTEVQQQSLPRTFHNPQAVNRQQHAPRLDPAVQFQTRPVPQPTLNHQSLAKSLHLRNPSNLQPQVSQINHVPQQQSCQALRTEIPPFNHILSEQGRQAAISGYEPRPPCQQQPILPAQSVASYEPSLADGALSTTSWNPTIVWNLPDTASSYSPSIDDFNASKPPLIHGAAAMSRLPRIAEAEEFVSSCLAQGNTLPSPPRSPPIPAKALVSVKSTSRDERIESWRYDVLPVEDGAIYLHKAKEHLLSFIAEARQLKLQIKAQQALETRKNIEAALIAIHEMRRSRSTHRPSDKFRGLVTQVLVRVVPSQLDGVYEGLLRTQRGYALEREKLLEKTLGSRREVSRVDGGSVLDDALQL
ncbi:hypothetical protein G7046_g6776 [Stylonectria norvegica]|nr:hypothetical protein G7046_g6776 [Stylonectria norvegica]